MIHIIVPEIDKPTTLLAALRQAGVSATMRRRIKHNGTCLINEKPAVWQDWVHDGDQISVELPKRNDFKPQNMSLTIRYEDSDVLVVDKPAGLLMHPTSGHYDGTLANGIAYYYQQTHQDCAFHPMHRLDRNTSGLVLLAKQPQIQYLFEKHHLFYSRKYAALVTGTFPYHTISVKKPIVRCPDSIIKRRVSDEGKIAWSDFTCIGTSAAYSLVTVSLHTGKTHQIRVHSSYLGFPLLGDDLYGGTYEWIQRQALHAYCMEFTHPITGAFIHVDSPLPSDMAQLVSREGWIL